MRRARTTESHTVSSRVRTSHSAASVLHLDSAYRRQDTQRRAGPRPGAERCTIHRYPRAPLLAEQAGRGAPRQGPMATEPPASSPRVLVVAPMPPEKAAYALARYSRSPDSIVQSLDWVRRHSAEKFLDTFYFQYGHASIADLGHCTLCFEGISELAAIEIEDEQLWDGQAKSTRYQDLSGSRAVVPEDLRGTPHEDTYARAARAQLRCYSDSHAALVASLSDANPKPKSMSVARYRRTINARAFDVARYLLLAGLPTNVGQVTSIRTLEKQMRRMGVSEYPEVRSIAEEMHAACGAAPGCSLDADSPSEPLAPTLAKYADPDTAREQALGRVAAWARQNFSAAPGEAPHDVDLLQPSDTLDEAAATWLYAVTDSPFRVVLDTVSTWSSARKSEVLEAALQDRQPPRGLAPPLSQRLPIRLRHRLRSRCLPGPAPAPPLPAGSPAIRERLVGARDPRGAGARSVSSPPTTKPWRRWPRAGPRSAASPIRPATTCSRLRLAAAPYSRWTLRRPSTSQECAPVSRATPPTGRSLGKCARGYARSSQSSVG